MAKINSNIRVEFVGDINSSYPCLEVFYRDCKNPFLDIGITTEKELNFKFYSIAGEMNLSLEDMSAIMLHATEFLSKALKNEEYYGDSNL